mmetsp:Transcript_11929/g.21837  ORF Transcript_11929/g.21837 Transcript_11929/m.21837 type:complete len:110 (+) Transcript_11929:1245-1574(+)
MCGPRLSVAPWRKGIANSLLLPLSGVTQSRQATQGGSTYRRALEEAAWSRVHQPCCPQRTFGLGKRRRGRGGAAFEGSSEGSPELAVPIRMQRPATERQGDAEAYEAGA